MFTSVKIFLLLAVISISTGCGAGKYIDQMMGGVDNTEPPSPLVSFTETTRVNLLWSDDASDGTDERFMKLGPAILGDQIFVADTEGNIAALDIKTGNSLWHKNSKQPITAGPSTDTAHILVGTNEGTVLALSAETGEEIWRTNVSSEILSAPKESDGIVIVRATDGKIFALNNITGERLWFYDHTVPVLTLRGTSTPAITKGVVIAGFDGGWVAALDLKTGKLLWETRIAMARGRSELERMVDIDVQPLIINDIIYVVAFQANVSALSFETGQILWQRSISSYKELDADGTNLYVTTEPGHVMALSRFSGTTIWHQEKLQARNITGPVIFDDKLVVGDFEGYLHWIDKKTGDFVARTRVSDQPVLTKPLVHNGVLFTYTRDGTLAAYTYSDKDVKDIAVEPIEKEEALAQPEAIPEQSDVEEKKSIFGKFLEIFTATPDEEETE